MEHISSTFIVTEPMTAFKLVLHVKIADSAQKTAMLFLNDEQGHYIML